jgi:YVTN family beta-propeller protein
MLRAKLFLGITIICLIFGIGQSQWLETTIYVPDSLIGVLYPQIFTYNATNNRIYVSGEESQHLIVIDGETNQKIAKIPIGEYPSALCWNSVSNKVYCTDEENDNVTIVDGATNQVITTIEVFGGARTLLYNPTDNKVYCAGGNITIINGATNTLINYVLVGNNPSALAYNSTNNKVYCADWAGSDVVVIDGATNQVITTTQVGLEPSVLLYNPTNNKIYCANHYNSVSVIDCVTDQQIAWIWVGEGVRAFAYNPIQNRVYVAASESSSISVIRDEFPGIEERSTLDVERFTPEIYPNPARSFLAIRLPYSADRQILKIFDVSGKLVREIAFPESGRNDRNEEIISLKGINPGIYFLRLGKGTKKFLVVK